MNSLFGTMPWLVQFDPIALQLGPIVVRWYGLMYLAAFVVFLWLGRRRARATHSPLAPQQLDDLLFYGVLGVVLGGRLGYMLVYGSDQLFSDPLSLLRIWEGGMSFHGGLVGVILVLIIYGRRQGCGFWALADFTAPLVPQGLMFGRIGNFVNGELWGHLTDKPWGMIFPDALPVPVSTEDMYKLYQLGALNDQARHPSPLYQAGLEGLLLFVLLYWYSRKPRPRMAVSGWFLVGYGLFRSVAEFFRVPDSHLGHLAFGWLTMGHLLSLPMIIGGGVLLWVAYRRRSEAEVLVTD